MTVPKIDTSNITNAFVSGMKEDLKLFGNQYNYIVVAWTVGYIIGQWVCSFFFYSKLSSTLTPVYMQPSNFILTRVRAHSKPLSEHSCFGSTETYLTVIFQSGSPSLKLGGQFLRLVSQVQRHTTKSSLFDSSSVYSKQVIGQLYTTFLAVGIINVN